MGSPAGSGGEESACNVGYPSSIPGLERSPGEGNGCPLWYSCLENPIDKGAWRATVSGHKESDTTHSQRARHYWTTNTFTYCLHEFSVLSVIFTHKKNHLWGRKLKSRGIKRLPKVTEQTSFWLTQSYGLRPHSGTLSCRLTPTSPPDLAAWGPRLPFVSISPFPSQYMGSAWGGLRAISSQ